jgi:YD repeat-containing protein
MTKILLALLVLTMATDASAQSRTYYDSSGRSLGANDLLGSLGLLGSLFCCPRW